MVGLALLVGGCGEKEIADENPAKEEAPVEVPIREVEEAELEKRNGVNYVKGENTAFTGMAIKYYPYGSKYSETLYVDGKKNGTQAVYKEDGSKWIERVWENGKEISEKRF